MDKKRYHSVWRYMILKLPEIGRLFSYAIVLYLFIVALIIRILLAGIIRKLGWNVLRGEKLFEFLRYIEWQG